MEVSPTLSAGSGGAVASRPTSTRATVRDGIMMRWYGDNNNMLRRPRTSSTDAGKTTSSGQTLSSFCSVAVT